MPTQTTLPARTSTSTSPLTALPVHPRRVGWRAGAAASLVEQGVTALRAGRSPHVVVEALMALGAADRPRGLAAAEELDRRLASGLPSSVAASGSDDATGPSGLTDVLFDRLDESALTGCPHPGEWVASSVDVVPCAVHGYEDGPVECLARYVGAHLALLAGPAAGAGASLAAQVLAAAVLPGPVTVAEPVRTALWVGLAATAVLREHAARR